MKTLIKPSFLQPGDTIGVYSPSAGIGPSLTANYERGKAVLTSRGYRIRESAHAFERRAHYSSDAKSKASDFMDLIRDPEVKALLPTIGGTTAYQLLTEIQYDAVKQHPKMIFGFSDNSLQACVIHDKTGLVTFHGHSDVVFGLGDLGDADKMKGFSKGGKYTSQQFFSALEGTIRPGAVEKATQWRTLRGGQAKGRLIGGNLDVLQILHGTPYALDFAGRILFWEAAYIELHRVDLILASFALAGVLGKIAGMIVGKPANVEEKFFDKPESMEEIILRHCAPYKFPIIVDGDIGHDMECCALPLGVMAEMDEDQLVLLETPFNNS